MNRNVAKAVEAIRQGRSETAQVFEAMSDAERAEFHGWLDEVAHWSVGRPMTDLEQFRAAVLDTLGV